MPAEVRWRPQVNVNFETNNMVSERLSRGMVYRELYLRLTGAATVAGAANIPANIQRGDEWGVVKKIELIANNTDVLRSFSGNALWWLNYFLYGPPPHVTELFGDGATANPAFDSTLILPCWIPRALRPMDTALDARELSDLKVQITWGTFTDINSTGSAWTTEPVLQVHSLECFNVGGPFSQWRVYTLEQEITATNPQFQIILPVGPVYRGFMLNFTDAGADAGAILNNFKVKAGTTIYADIPDEILRQIHSRRVNVDRPYDPVTFLYDDLRVGDDNDFDGWYWFDHITDGYLTEGIDTLGFSEFELELDVTVGVGTTKVHIYPLQLIPVRGQAG